MGIKLNIKKDKVKVLGSKNIKPTSIMTEPYPGFPTDLQAQIMVLMTKSERNFKNKRKYF